MRHEGRMSDPPPILKTYLRKTPRLHTPLAGGLLVSRGAIMGHLGRHAVPPVVTSPPWVYVGLHVG